MTGSDPLRERWRRLVDRDLPAEAARRPDWPVRHDHCFARILLDAACGRPWRDAVRPPAWRHMPADRLSDAVRLGEAVLAGSADLSALNRASLGMRRKAGPARST